MAWSPPGHMSATLQSKKISNDPFYFWFLDILWKWTNGVESTDSNQECKIVTKISPTEYLSVWHILGNLETAEVLRDYVASNPQLELI